jgi:4-amino-4-deoxy-L-arabinose transferase-like glycosyltransferase
MRRAFSTHWIFFLILLIMSIFFLWGVAKIPFHPDESTLIFMSADFERLITEPGSMSWKAGEPIPDSSRYRMIDAPITRYLLGFGRILRQQAAPQVDWDWSASWEENQEAGALPTVEMLLIERLVMACLFPLTIVLLYLIGLELNGRLLGILAVLIFSLNPLILLHTRRAMAEGVLVFGLVLCLYFFMKLEKYPVLVGLAVAVAFNAKHSAWVLLPIGLLAVCSWAYSNYRDIFRILYSSVKYLAGFIFLTILLNPFLWQNPVAAASEALNQRQALLARQKVDLLDAAPGQVLETPIERIPVVLAHLIIAPPIFAEVGNYRAQTLPAEREYLQSPGNAVGRNLITGGLLLGFILLGIFALIRQSFNGNPDERRNSVFLLLTTFMIFTGIVVMIPLSWQRYFVPLIPFVSIITGFGLVWGIKTSRRIFSHGRLSSRLSQVLTQFSSNSRMP